MPSFLYSLAPLYKHTDFKSKKLLARMENSPAPENCSKIIRLYLFYQKRLPAFLAISNCNFLLRTFMLQYFNCKVCIRPLHLQKHPHTISWVAATYNPPTKVSSKMFFSQLINLYEVGASKIPPQWRRELASIMYWKVPLLFRVLMLSAKSNIE